MTRFIFAIINGDGEPSISFASTLFIINKNNSNNKQKKWYATIRLKVIILLENYGTE